jgi:diguanylate cyclase
MTGRVVLLLWTWLCLGTGAGARELVEVGNQPSLALWPAVRVLVDAEHRLNVQDVLARRADMQQPMGTAGNLGKQPHTVWLHLPLRVPGTETLHRVLRIDYPSLNRVDVFLVHNGRVLQQHATGALLPTRNRPMPSRTLSAPLRLDPGEYEVLLRVRTDSSMVLPLSLMTYEAFSANEASEQMLLGLLLGLALCMLLYSLSHCLTLRDPLFLVHALLVLGTATFFAVYFGIAQQYLWPEWTVWAQRIGPLAILVSVVAGSRFAWWVLAPQEVSPLLAWALRVTGVAGVLTLLAGLLGLPYPALQTLTTLLGVAMPCAVMPVALLRTLRGERAAAYLLAGWLFFVVGAVSMAALLRGYLEPGFWSQHLFMFCSTAEVAAWMGVLAMRVQAIHRQADRTRIESETLRTLAHTDALTGLPNRRGLHGRLTAALPATRADHLLAVYLLDLDGFKPINDTHGHDVGDALLVAVGLRLQTQLRGSDVVARLGGDEFVVLAAGLPDEAAARALGQKMLLAFDTPFEALGQRCAVGLTIGYSLAPLDGQTADDLVKRADAAMYAGKQSGRRQVQRGGRSLVAA